MKISLPKNRLTGGNIGVFFVILVAAVIVVITLIPPEITPTKQGNCLVGDEPASKEVLRLPAVKNQFEPPRMGQPPDLSLGGPDPSEKADYVLIRSNVPTAKESTPEGWTFLGGSEKSPVEHTINIGEIPEKPGYDLYYPSEWGEIDLLIGGRYYLRRQGMILFVKNDPAFVKEVDGKHIYMTEVYQDKRVLEDPNKPYKTEDWFYCLDDQKLEPPHLTTPEQNVSSDQKQLQLQWFYLKAENYWAVHCKPAVYLYPPKKMLVNVKVHPAGQLMYTDPLYPENGWNVEANPDGQIVNLGSNNFMKQYDYLYFESRVPDSIIQKPTKGWVLKPTELETKFNEILPRLGLNDKQTNDFIEYWKKALPDSPYYFIGIINKINVNQIEGLEITPKPDSINRVRIYFERLDSPINVEIPELPETSKLSADNSFNVVEWGGMVKNDPNHPFTCSQ